MDSRERHLHRVLLEFPSHGELPRDRHRHPPRQAFREHRLVSVPGSAPLGGRSHPRGEAGRAASRERRDLLRPRGEPRGRRELRRPPARLRPRRRGDGGPRAAARLAPPRHAAASRVRARHRRIDRRYRALHRARGVEFAAAGLVRRPRDPAIGARAGASPDALFADQRRVRAGDVRSGARRHGERGPLVAVLPHHRAAAGRVGQHDPRERDSAPGDARRANGRRCERALLRPDLPVVPGSHVWARACRRRRQRNGHGVRARQQGAGGRRGRD